MEKKKNTYPFELLPLPYAYDALEPHIDEFTMHLHHDRHLKTYVDNLNAALKDYPELHSWTLEQLLCYSGQIPEKIRTAVINNGGGVYNHNLYFEVLNPLKKPYDAKNLQKMIISQYKSLEDFKNEFKKQALATFGSGYTWLAQDKDGKLQIIKTQNQDTILPQNNLSPSS